MPNTNHPDYPEEYILGRVQFFSKDFIITPDVLIPRLETECLVRKARNVARTIPESSLIDIGTGSWIIGVSCADIESIRSIEFSDISPDALAVAEKNARNLITRKDLSLTFSLGNLLKNYTLQGKTLPKTPLIITANLPYIKQDDWEHMSPDTKFEPELALFGWKTTWFELYDILFEQLKNIKHSEDIFLIIEFWYDQTDIARKTIEKIGWKYEIFPDYAGIERFASIHIPPQ